MTSDAWQQPRGIRGAFLDCIADPFRAVEPLKAVRWVRDGLLVVAEGRIQAFGPWPVLRRAYPRLPVTAYPQRLILPGFVDAHVHYPQTEIVAAYGEQLFEWLRKYVFPAELKLRNKAHARAVADLFLDTLLANGTTTAQVFTTTFPASVDAFFEASSARNLCVISGLTGVDRAAQAPPDYRDTADSFYANSTKLIRRWHRRGRNRYAITPRYALGSTRAQLARAGQLKREHPDCWVNTHMAETRAEVAAVARAYPESSDYLNVYERAGLVGPKFSAGHCIHVGAGILRRLSRADAAIAFCPRSNLFLGSGLFNLARATSLRHPVRVGIGTDVGAGDSFSVLGALNEAYKVCALQGGRLSAFEGLYLATLGGARALHLDDEIGSFAVGKYADFVVWDLASTRPMQVRRAPPGMERRTDAARRRLEHQLFGLMMLGDDRCVEATYVAGRVVHRRTALTLPTDMGFGGAHAS